MRVLICLKTIRQCLPTSCLLELIHSLVISRISFASSLTLTASKTVKNIYQKLLNFAIRIIYNKCKYDHISGFRDRHNWDSLSCVLEKEFFRIISKMVRGESSHYLNGLLKKTEHDRTRYRLYTYPAANSTAGERTFKTRASAYLNRGIRNEMERVRL